MKASYYASLLPGIECCDLVSEGVPCAFLHDRCTLLTLTAGETLVWCRGERHVLTPGVVLLAEPGDVYRDAEPAAYRALSVMLTEATLARAGVGAPLRLSRVVAHSPELTSTLVTLAEAIRAGRELGTQQDWETRLLDGLAHFWTLEASREEPPLVARARRALLAAHPHAVSLEALGGRLRCAPSYLCRVFSEHVGLGPHAYQLQLRLLAAAKLLANGESVARAARRCGFSSASHLRRHFQRRFGVAPGEYVLHHVPETARREMKPTPRLAVELA